MADLVLHVKDLHGGPRKEYISGYRWALRDDWVAAGLAFDYHRSHDRSHATVFVPPGCPPEQVESAKVSILDLFSTVDVSFTVLHVTSEFLQEAEAHI